MTTLAQALRAAAGQLAAAGIEAPRREAMLLVELATGWSRTQQLVNKQAPLTPTQADRLSRLVERRTAREPFAYLAGLREFYGRPFQVGPGVLVPRPETEILIDTAREVFPDPEAHLRILDIGVGSGCILLTLLAEFPSASGVGVDRSRTALEYTRKNAAALRAEERLDLFESDWGGAIHGAFDLIVSNPPYVDAGDLALLEPELAWEPGEALSPGADGTASYRAMTPDLLRLLAPGGVVLLEIGQGQDVPLSDWFGQHDLDVVVRPDLAGIGRCLVLTRPSTAS
ncbi:peptide chain release factor N(5)-glutamine methyltransferase [Geminicoccus roseus]|uniref:peptide chain release factor N(5)-glutamine methyltransferase n=1 Tax=Geminicoccus roseus TaxID=404900 RepID=UPI00040061A1|nr:peptide chain release factor N(5)-glutamine methyltransferase [Geminicoccus roseus]